MGRLKKRWREEREAPEGQGGLRCGGPAFDGASPFPFLKARGRKERALQ